MSSNKITRYFKNIVSEFINGFHTGKNLSDKAQPQFLESCNKSLFNKSISELTNLFFSNDFSPLLLSPEGNIAIHVHIYYLDLIDEIIFHLRSMPFKYHLFISVGTEEATKVCLSSFKDLPNLIELEIESVPNRGRDIAPFFCAFEKRLYQFDYVAHIHTKKSPHSKEVNGWREYLYNSLFGNEEHIRRIFGAFKSGADLIFPQCYSRIPYAGNSTLANAEKITFLCSQLGINNRSNGYFDFPVGSMFWARGEAIAPLFKLNLNYYDFEIESGQTDGTLAHTLERMIGIVPTAFSKNIFILRDELNISWSKWRFDQFLSRDKKYYERIISDDKVELVIFDVFETLLICRVLDSSFKKVIVAKLIGGSIGKDYLKYRQDAEISAIKKCKKNVSLVEIYEELKCLGLFDETTIKRILDKELAVEQDLYDARSDIQEIFNLALDYGKKVVLISESFLQRSHIELILKKCGYLGCFELYLSSELSLTKENGDLYDYILEREKVSSQNVLVIGGDEYLDFQIPSSKGFQVRHITKPLDLALGFPRFSSLISATDIKRDINSNLTVGLLIKKFYSKIFFGAVDPISFFGEVSNSRLIGYGLVGPILLSFVHWLFTSAKNDGVKNLYFISRESQLIKLIYDRYSNSFESDASKISDLKSTKLFINKQSPFHGTDAIVDICYEHQAKNKSINTFNQDTHRYYFEINNSPGFCDTKSISPNKNIFLNDRSSSSKDPIKFGEVIFSMIATLKGNDLKSIWPQSEINSKDMFEIQALKNSNPEIETHQMDLILGVLDFVNDAIELQKLYPNFEVPKDIAVRLFQIADANLMVRSN